MILPDPVHDHPGGQGVVCMEASQLRQAPFVVPDSGRHRPASSSDPITVNAYPVGSTSLWLQTDPRGDRQVDGSPGP